MTEDIWSDAELVDSARNGDHHAYDALVERYRVRMLSRESGNLALTFPVLYYNDMETLTPVVDGVVACLHTQILNSATADCEAQLQSAGYGRLSDQFSGWGLTLRGLIAGESLHELVNRGSLTEPGSPVAPTFCLLGWSDRSV